MDNFCLGGRFLGGLGGRVAGLGLVAALQLVQGQLLLAQGAFGLAALVAGAGDAVVDGKALPAGFFGGFKLALGGLLFAFDALALLLQPGGQGRAFGGGLHQGLGGLGVGGGAGAVLAVQRGAGAGGQGQAKGEGKDGGGAHGEAGVRKRGALR